MAQDVVRLAVGGVELETFSSYELVSDMLTPADAWSMTAPVSGDAASRAGLRAAIDENWSSVEVSLSRDGTNDTRSIQLTGIVDNVAFACDRQGGATLRIQGRDRAGVLVSSSADPSLGVTEETYFTEAILQLVAPYGFRVICENAPARLLASGASVNLERPRLLRAYARASGLDPEEVERTLGRRIARERGAPLIITRRDGSALDGSEDTPDDYRVERARRGHASGMIGADVENLRVREAKPQVGETVWDFIVRHCRRFGVMPWVNARGHLVLSSPDYDQEPLYQLRRSLTPGDQTNNILAGGWVRSYQALSSSITVYGRTGGHDATRSPFHATVEPGDVPFLRPMVIHDGSVRSSEEAERRARHEVAQQRQDGFALEYDVQGHGQGRVTYIPDTVAEVIDEAVGVADLYYITSRVFTKSRENGTKTRLRLVPLGSLVL